MRDTHSPKARRALAAIMFADMVGYSALMAGDEARAYEARVRYRRALATATERHGGEVIQHYGDGSLTLFSSAVEATRAAVFLQRMLRVGDPVPVRVGLHLADVVRDEDGVYGSGVNVAARIESLAAPGSVVISDRVARELSNQPGIDTIALGTVQLKNIREPMDVYAVDDPALVIPGLGEMTINAQRATRGDTMAVTAGKWISKPSASASAPATPPCQEVPTVQGPLAGLLYELHRRRVFRVLMGYLVVVMGTLTGLEHVGPSLGLPGWVIQAAVAAALLGLPVTVALAWVYDVTPRGILRTGGTRADIGRLGLVASGGLLLASGVLATVVSNGDVTSVAEPTLVPGAAESSGALAVLPLSVYDDADHGFSEALHESLVTSLGQVPGLPVLSHASVESYDAASAGAAGVRRLGASLALEGCVQRVGGEMRVLIRLVDTEHGHQLWSARFDRAYSESVVLELQSDIADAVAEGLEDLLAPRASSPVQATAYVGA